MTDRVLRNFLPFLSAVVILFAAAGNAGAENIEFKMPKDASDYSVDGNDIYVVQERVVGPRFRETSTASIFRYPLTGGSGTKIASFKKNVDVSIRAGGGIVYAQTFVEDFESGDGKTRGTIERISRDGSTRMVLAEGNQFGFDQFVGISTSKEFLLRCGVGYALRAVGEDGSAVISELRSERTTHACGSKKNLERWTFTLIGPAGDKTTLVSAKRSFRAIRCACGDAWHASSAAPETSFSISGDKVLFHSRKAGGAFIFNITTQTMSGPFDSVQPGHLQAAESSVDPDGRIAVNEYRGKTLNRSHLKSGVFRTTASPISFAPFMVREHLEFCGRHLVAIGKSSIREYDPDTYALRRVIVEFKGGWDDYSDWTCDSKAFYVDSERKGAQTIVVHPF